MAYRLAVAAMLLLSSAASAPAQQQPARPITPEPLAPPAAPAPGSMAPPAATAPEPAAPPSGRVFCGQSVTYRLADPAAIPELFRQFVGVWSDAEWTAQLCAALIVENVQTDGTATITYVFGPLGANARAAGGVLHGTGIVHDGVLLFQNRDGSQYAFKPFYADLSGRYTTPQRQSYEAVFKKTY